MDAVLENPRSAPISEREKVLLAYIEHVNGNSYALRREEVDAVRAAGWSDEAIYDAITVCALFNFYNRWVDASRVHALSDETHRQGGKRSANIGYVRK